MAPACALYDAGLIQAVSVPQLATFDAAVKFARTEGIVPAPESAHAIRAAIDEALDAKTKGEKRVILFNLSGHGNFDMAAYQAYFSGKLEDYAYPVDAVKAALAELPRSACRLEQIVNLAADIHKIGMRVNSSHAIPIFGISSMHCTGKSRSEKLIKNPYYSVS
jgi:threonine synthase